MMYEIYFDPAAGEWRIRIVTIYFYFIPVHKDVCLRAGPEEKAGKVAGFVTFADAHAYAKLLGLHNAYHYYERNGGLAQALLPGTVHAKSA